ncbi:hypothetical protein B0H66DRAFT_535796 [Apodospora peruviana]|uniref:Uncharacterized protein n=1 Tax=Apodospora peruviana TaxID=516989 RepID=A0AAE0HXX7_9PEZI|nr:hypothetical protein B0H66DRAFT_535796 [Apodospora peruviana]
MEGGWGGATGVSCAREAGLPVSRVHADWRLNKTGHCQSTDALATQDGAGRVARPRKMSVKSGARMAACRMPLGAQYGSRQERTSRALLLCAILAGVACPSLPFPCLRTQCRKRTRDSVAPLDSTPLAALRPHSLTANPV